MSRRPEGGHPRHRLDPVIHAPVRLSIVAYLSAADQAEFGVVRDTIEVSDSVLSKQVTVLVDAGYVRARKGYVGKRPRTWLSLTAAGRQAFDAHLAALTAIAARPAMSAETLSERSPAGA
ncbi:winged helix-turn-helix domain-containing protein [Rhizomonospora bruguierae]|uniref:winged helix-turn-helix domain-containing protein n=1 Tax=Rhizomonospora bruguierae TaxID=1581705 RepID=UPI001BD171FF|nr:transcriptional regulator [Micromonospora sp. NBRC 107566]